MGADAAAVLRQLGGRASFSQLVAEVSRRELRRSLAAEEVVRAARGSYCLPTTPRPLLLARQCGGVLSHASAAQHHGLSLVTAPEVVDVLLRPGRAARDVQGTRVRRSRLTEQERRAGVTGPARTVLDCAAILPLPQALAVADSALRIGLVAPQELVALAGNRRGRGCGDARTVAALADERAANAFESALRGHLLLAGITSFVPQHVITGPGVFAQVDLADPDRRVALEADGYAVHGDRRRFARDLRRHDELATLGWLTLRFAWEHVMFQPVWVVEQVQRALDGRRRRAPGIHRGGSRGTNRP